MKCSVPCALSSASATSSRVRQVREIRKTAGPETKQKKKAKSGGKCAIL